jgi:predicted ribosomally synthesized peptide with SipW-like signal peptide
LIKEGGSIMKVKNTLMIGVATAAIGTALISGGAYALFSDNVITTGNTIASGTIKLSAVNDQTKNDPISTFNIANCKPTDTFNKTLYLTNVGSLNIGHIYLTLENYKKISGDAQRYAGVDLGSQIMVTNIQLGDGPNLVKTFGVNEISISDLVNKCSGNTTVNPAVVQNSGIPTISTNQSATSSNTSNVVTINNSTPANSNVTTNNNQNATTTQNSANTSLTTANQTSGVTINQNNTTTSSNQNSNQTGDSGMISKAIDLGTLLAKTPGTTGASGNSKKFVMEAYFKKDADDRYQGAQILLDMKFTAIQEDAPTQSVQHKL